MISVSLQIANILKKTVTQRKKKKKCIELTSASALQTLPSGLHLFLSWLPLNILSNHSHLLVKASRAQGLLFVALPAFLTLTPGLAGLASVWNIHTSSWRGPRSPRNS